MPKKQQKYNHRDNLDDEQLSPIESLFAGQKGPLPLDNDVRLQSEEQEPTADETRLSASERRSDGWVEGILEDHPGLTEQELERMLEGS